jgi:hypothetical protein
MIATGMMTALAFLVGGMGVRQSNWPAAATVFALFFVGLLYGMASGQFPGFLAIIAAAILLSNVRAAFLASEWRPAGEDEDKPMRFNDTFGDKLADQLPAKIWPVLQVPFFALAGVLLLLSLVGLAIVAAQRFGILPNVGGAH